MWGQKARGERLMGKEGFKELRVWRGDDAYKVHSGVLG